MMFVLKIKIPILLRNAITEPKIVLNNYEPGKSTFLM